MNILEKDLEETIYDATNEQLWDRGLFVMGRCLRQLRIGNYGVADLVYVKRLYQYDTDEITGTFTRESILKIEICELKKEKAGISAFLQAVRYAKGIQSYLQQRKFKNFQILITLIAPEIDINSDYIFLTDLIASNNIGYVTAVNNYKVSYGIDGLRFDQKQGYEFQKNGFKL